MTASLVYTASELAEALGVSERHLRTMARTPDGPPMVPFGRRLLFPRAAVDQWLLQVAAGGGDAEATRPVPSPGRVPETGSEHVA